MPFICKTWVLLLFFIGFEDATELPVTNQFSLVFDADDELRAKPEYFSVTAPDQRPYENQFIAQSTHNTSPTARGIRFP